ncbi:MAG: peptide chain release factor 3 [Ignavibacteriales bacterium]|nr:peptide chain release factor 3 [Ignavibacteriales bacterium]
MSKITPRRTFAIISHPDAGKTTLTEKFLLYGGAVQLAGSVTARRNQRASTSDWMELERKRGISISSTVLQFDYNGFRVNLLDTPGHQDFSEDTYRVLTAVDAVIMVIDAAKGIETQTRKLFEVCHRRGIPIFTFINKLDHPTKDPLELLDELEHVLGIGAYPMNWPIGTGQQFHGLFDRRGKTIHLFERVSGGEYRAPVEIFGLHDENMREHVDARVLATAQEEMSMLDGAGFSFDQDAILTGRQTPVYFGSAKNNFGVQLLLDGYLGFAPDPQPRRSAQGFVPAEEDEAFSGFIFKIQANMDPRHRDRIAFLRICSGSFSRDMFAIHARTGKKIRLSNAAKLFGQQRETVEEGFPGDIIGLVGHDDFGIGDTLTVDPAIVYDEIPRFPPECFALLHSPNPANYKRLRDGLDQLLQEGVVQSFQLLNSGSRTPVLAAVGPLQFEVVQYRLENEYGATTRLENTDWKLVRWVHPDTDLKQLSSKLLPTTTFLAEDVLKQPAIIFANDWALNYFLEQHKEVKLSDEPWPEESQK